MRAVRYWSVSHAGAMQRVYQALERLLIMIDPLLRYTLSLPVAAAVVGMPKLDYIRHNTGLARNFEPMPRHEMDNFSREMSEGNKMALDARFCRHEDV